MIPTKQIVVLLAMTGLLASHSTPLLAQRVMSEGIKDLATQIATNVAKEQKKRIAILPFRELNGHATVLGSYVAEELVTDLFAIGGLEIVERSMLDKVIGELKLDRTGLIDPESAKKIGRIAGAGAIVAGSITDLQSYVALNCRLVDAETGRIFAAAQAKILKDDDVRKIMGEYLAGTTPVSQGASAAGESRNAGRPVIKPVRRQVNGYAIDLLRCSRSGSEVTCELNVMSTKEDHAFAFWSGYSRLIVAGEVYECVEATIGTTKSRSDSAQLPQDIPFKASITFNAPPDAGKADLVEINSSAGLFQFRDVLIRKL
jgi:curli biogenesis system outer membrane secretion channel CsgG